MATLNGDGIFVGKYDAGILAISVGVNQDSAPPGVPFNTPFIWRDPGTGESLIACWHPGGYSGYNWGLDMDSKSDCVSLPGFRCVELCRSTMPLICSAAS